MLKPFHLEFNSVFFLNNDKEEGDSEFNLFYLLSFCYYCTSVT